MNGLYFNYIGEVNIKYEHSGKIYTKNVHNNGCEKLFRFFARALCGQDVRNDRPSRIMLKYEENGTYVDGLSTSMASGISYNKDTENSDYYIVTITSTIPYEQIINNAKGKESYRLYLQDASRNDLAYIEVNASDVNNVSIGTQAIIEWKLKIVNISTNS